MHSTKRSAVRSNFSRNTKPVVRRRVGATPSPILQEKNEKSNWASIAAKPVVKDDTEKKEDIPKPKPVVRKSPIVIEKEKPIDRDDSPKPIVEKKQDISKSKPIVRRKPIVIEEEGMRRNPRKLNVITDEDGFVKKAGKAKEAKPEEEFPSLSREPTPTSSLSAASPWSAGRSAIVDLAKKPAQPKNKEESEEVVSSHEERDKSIRAKKGGLVAKNLSKYSSPIVRKLPCPSIFSKRNEEEDDEDCGKFVYEGGWDDGEPIETIDDFDDIPSESESDISDYDDEY